MALDLPIYFLDALDSFSFQKCLIPKSLFPENARPGQWAKCFFKEVSSDKQYYALTQIFPRTDLEGVSYLDTCVSNYEGNEGQQLVLTSLTLLEKAKEVQSANVELHLIPESFIDDSSSFTCSKLQTLAKILLQQYHLTQCCIIKDKFLLKKGVDSISIQIESDCNNCSHFITDNTVVKIRNIFLRCKTFSRDKIVLGQPYEKVRNELNGLLQLLRSQREAKKTSFHMNTNAIIVGAVGSGKTTLVEEFLKEKQCNVFNISVSNCLKPYPGETEQELRKIFKAACEFESKFKTKEPVIILLEEIHLLCPRSTSNSGNNSEAIGNYMRISAQLITLIDDIFTSRKNIMCLATTSKPDNVNELLRRQGRFENEITIPNLREEDRSDILKKLFEKCLANFNIDSALIETLARQTQGYVIADLALFVRNVSQSVLKKPEVKVEDLITATLRKSKPISLTETDVSAYKTTERFESIGGMLKLKKMLEVAVLAGLKQEESFKRFGLSLPKGVLLYGPPGCAKTTIAKCLATEANMTFIATSGAEVYSPYVGSAEKFIMKIFKTARKNAPCLIFLDEIDSLVGRRGLTGSTNSSDVQVRILSTLLTEMDGILGANQNQHIIVVAATNRPDMVDDALMRPGRFDKLIHVPAPDLLSRYSILELCKRKMSFSLSIDLNYLAHQTENYSGADICNLCNEAAMQAFQRDINAEEILLDDFEYALKTTKSSLTESQIDFYYQFENKYL